MRREDLLYFIGEYLTPVLQEELSDGRVKNIEFDADSGTLEIKAVFGKYIGRETIVQAQESVKNMLDIRRVRIFCCYPGSVFSKECVWDIFTELKTANAAANGFLDNAEIKISGNNLEIKAREGARVLNETESDLFIEEYIFDHFGENYNVTISDYGDVKFDSPEYIEMQKSNINIDIPEDFGEKTKKPERAYDDLPISLTNARILYGNRIKSKPVPLSGVSIEDGNVTVWGKVFKLDVRETKDKNRKIISFNISDYTYSYTVKIFDLNENVAKLVDNLSAPTEKNPDGGSVVLVRGHVEYDDYIKAYCIKANSVTAIEEIAESDDAEEKRVELHMHTSMSSMDGVTDAGRLVKRAIKWGHKAVAITDHGVVQAFPSAFQASEGKDIKVIYGMEGYFVDDSVRAVTGDMKMSLDGSFVIFDVETTGLRTGYDRLTEIGAVKYEDGVEKTSFRTFVNPGMKIPQKIVEKTGIDDSMVADAPGEKEAVEKFLEFARGSVLVAHNATFDTDIIKAVCARNGLTYDFTHIDTLILAQELTDREKIKKYALDAVAGYFRLPKFDHHRADEDARILALIYSKLTALMKEKGITSVEEINDVIKPDPRKLKSRHIILLARNTTGLKNLYKLITASNLSYYYRVPRVPLSELQAHREGILVGSACEAGQLYQAVYEGKPRETLLKYAGIYDYLEIQPNGNNMFMVRDNLVESEEDLNDINRQIISLADELGIPVVATGDVHFMDKSDSVFREIVMTNKGFSDADRQAPLYFRTTNDMLAEFAYLGEGKAREVVIENPNKIADMCEVIRPVPKGTFTPSIPGSDDDLRRICNQRMEEYYGSPLPQYIRERLDKELDSIIKNGYAVLYMIAQKLVANSMENGYYVGSRGSVGSSFVAFASGISEVNPLAPHYLCSKCKHSEFFLNGEYGSGFDMPPKECPECGAPMVRDGHDIPFETFLGFFGDKAPDIDLNFASEYQFQAHRFTETLFKPGHVFKAGTIGTVAEKTAFGFVKKWIEEKNNAVFNEPKNLEILESAGIDIKAKDFNPEIAAKVLNIKLFSVSTAEMERLAAGCVGIKRTTGQHPGGMVVVPNEYEAEDFTPIQHPADDPESIHKTTHFDFHFLHDTILKLDNLGHEVPTMYHHLELLTGTSVMDADVCDPKLYQLLTSPEPLGVTAEEIDCPTGTLSLPELGTPFVLGMLTEAKPKNFSDMLQISGLSHGTDVWLGNAQDLINQKVCTISEVIGTRDSIMVYLIHKGLENKMAFDIMEKVRKGKATAELTEDHINAMKEHDVPQWYIDSCFKIKYMFPKAHAAAYVIAAMRLAWYKLYYPVEYYATYLTVRGDDLETDVIMAGRQAVKRRMAELSEAVKNRTASDKEEKAYASLQVMNEMMARGIEILPIDIYKSQGSRYIVEDGKIRLPFAAIPGCGDAAALALQNARYKKNTVTGEDGTSVEEVTDEIAEFLSVEDFQTRSRASQAIMDTLESVGAFSSLPKSTQITFFDM